jgi:hypothetical protein
MQPPGTPTLLAGARARARAGAGAIGAGDRTVHDQKPKRVPTPVSSAFR